MKLQTPRHGFETLIMKSNELVQDYLSRAMEMISQMRSYGDQITYQFDHVVAAIEESKDLSNFSFDELIGSLQAYEARFNILVEKMKRKCFK